MPGKIWVTCVAKCNVDNNLECSHLLFAFPAFVLISIRLSLQLSLCFKCSLASFETFTEKLTFVAVFAGLVFLWEHFFQYLCSSSSPMWFNLSFNWLTAVLQQQRSASVYRYTWFNLNAVFKHTAVSLYLFVISRGLLTLVIPSRMDSTRQDVVLRAVRACGSCIAASVFLSMFRHPVP